MKNLFVLMLSIIVLGGCSSDPDLQNIKSASWSKALAFTECKQNAFTGTPSCAVSINEYENGAHTHIIETDKKTINAGEILTISRYRGKTKDISTLRKETYEIVEIVKEGNHCKLYINTIKYNDVYLVVSDCTSNE